MIPTPVLIRTRVAFDSAAVPIIMAMTSWSGATMSVLVFVLVMAFLLLVEVSGPGSLVGGVAGRPVGRVVCREV